MRTVQKRILIAGIVLLTFACVGMVSACDQGCTPGYWKKAEWPTNCWLTKGSLLDTQFGNNGDLNGDGIRDTAYDALFFGGGNGLYGAERVYFRAEVAAYLNACAGIDAHSTYEIDDVFAGIDYTDRDSWISAKDTLDAWNNLGCPLAMT